MLSNLPPGCTDAEIERHAGNDLDCICTRVCDCQSPPSAISNECPVHNHHPHPNPECLAGEHWFEADDPETPAPSVDIYTKNATLREQVKLLREACEYIATLGGNLPDDRHTSRTGPNDAVHRGLVYVEARRAARAALAATKETA